MICECCHKEEENNHIDYDAIHEKINRLQTKKFYLTKQINELDLKVTLKHLVYNLFLLVIC